MRESIVEAARDLVHTTGAVSLDEVAAIVGIKRHHVTAYFASVDSLAEAAGQHPPVPAGC